MKLFKKAPSGPLCPPGTPRGEAPSGPAQAAQVGLPPDNPPPVTPPTGGDLPALPPAQAAANAAGPPAAASAPVGAAWAGVGEAPSGLLCPSGTPQGEASSAQVDQDPALAALRAALDEREQALALREARIAAAQTLAERGLPAALLGALPTQSAEALAAALPLVESAFREAVEGAVRARLAGPPPPLSRGETARDHALRNAMGLE